MNQHVRKQSAVGSRGLAGSSRLPKGGGVRERHRVELSLWKFSALDGDVARKHEEVLL